MDKTPSKSPPRRCRALRPTTLLSTALMITVLQVWSQTPAPLLWLRADSALTPQSWTDQSGNAIVFTPVLGGLAPAKALNFNPALDLDSGSAWLVGYLDSLRPGKHTMMTVYRLSGGDEQGIWQYQADSVSRLGLSSRRILGTHSTITYAKSNFPSPALNVLTQKWPGPIPDGRPLSLGWCDSLPMRGLLAEVMLFDQGLTTLGYNVWQSALAIKYGITLSGCTYLNSLCDTIFRGYQGLEWVAGIATDTALGLTQRESGAYGDIVTIGLDTPSTWNSDVGKSLPDLNSLMWGCDGGAMAVDTTGYTVGQTMVMPLQRLWRMQIHGDSARFAMTWLEISDSSLACPGFADIALLLWADTDAVVPQVILPDSVDEAAGRALFRDLSWDQDLSGTDMFGFALAVPLQPRLGSVDQSSETDGPATLISCGLRPNPTPGGFVLEIVLNAPSTVRVELLETSGRVVRAFTLPEAAEHSYTGEVRTPGTYLVRITTISESTTLRLVVR